MERSQNSEKSENDRPNCLTQVYQCVQTSEPGFSIMLSKSESSRYKSKQPFATGVSHVDCGYTNHV